MASYDASWPPPGRYYGGTVASGYKYNDDSDDDGTDATPSPARPVYDEYDSDDNKVFPPPGPSTAIESTGHGCAILPTRDDEDAPLDDLFASIAAVMAAEKQRGKQVAAVEDGAFEAGTATAQQPPGGTVVYGHHEEFDAGSDAATRPGLSGSGVSNQCVYDEDGNDDCKELSAPGPSIVFESTSSDHGNTIVPMPMTRDDGDDDAPQADIDHDDLFASIAAAMAAEAEQQRGTVEAPGEHCASEAGSAAALPPPMRSISGTVAYGHYDAGKGAAPLPPLVGPSGSGMSNQCVYDEYDNDDNDVFPPPGPCTVIESTSHGDTTTPPMTTCGEGVPPPAYDDLFGKVTATGQQPKTPVAAEASTKGDARVVVAAAKHGSPGVEVDDEKGLEETYDEFFPPRGRRPRRAGDQTTAAGNKTEVPPSAWVAAGIAAAAARFGAVRRLVRRGG